MLALRKTKFQRKTRERQCQQSKRNVCVSQNNLTFSELKWIWQRVWQKTMAVQLGSLTLRGRDAPGDCKNNTGSASQAGRDVASRNEWFVNRNVCFNKLEWCFWHYNTCWRRVMMLPDWLLLLRFCYNCCLRPIIISRNGLMSTGLSLRFYDV